MPPEQLQERASHSSGRPEFPRRQLHPPRRRGWKLERGDASSACVAVVQRTLQLLSEVGDAFRGRRNRDADGEADVVNLHPQRHPNLTVFPRKLGLPAPIAGCGLVVRRAGTAPSILGPPLQPTARAEAEEAQADQAAKAGAGTTSVAATPSAAPSTAAARHCRRGSERGQATECQRAARSADGVHIRINTNYLPVSARTALGCRPICNANMPTRIA
jgi:hypothetical protein